MRNLVKFSLMIIDVGIFFLVPYLTLLVRFEGQVGNQYLDPLLPNLVTIVLINLGVFYIFRLYDRLWRYASIHDLVMIIGASTVSNILAGIYLFIVLPTGFPRSYYFLSWLLTVVLTGATRLAVRVGRYILIAGSSNNLKQVLIVGAGDAGVMLAREIQDRYAHEKNIVGFVDDAAYKQKQNILGKKVRGTTKDIEELAKKYNVQEIIIAMPSVSGSIIRDIVKICNRTKCNLKVLPGLYEIIEGKAEVNQLRNVDVEDLLRRTPIKLDNCLIKQILKDKVILITGAGGSIGSELARQVAGYSPKEIFLLGKGENSIYEIHSELLGKYPELKFTPIIADVRNEKRIEQIFSEYKVDIVYHAAAHKHVPLMEMQPIEAVLNNVFGTLNVAKACAKYEIDTFVMISTDKAVNPTSVMGATKRIAELVVQYVSQELNVKTKFAAVRFGNVLGSRGSVIPLFKKQIAQGGPVTVTDKEMIRYFMTIPEAVQLVLHSSAIATGGEVFVLDMGEPVKIYDMAKDLIELSGLEVDKDIQIKVTGMRPGEKLYEELLTAEEGTLATCHEKIFTANLKKVDGEKLLSHLAEFSEVSEADEVKSLIGKIVDSYRGK